VEYELSTDLYPIDLSSLVARMDHELWAGDRLYDGVWRDGGIPQDDVDVACFLPDRQPLMITADETDRRSCQAASGLWERMQCLN
jgi:hypothetical protein